MRLVLGQEFYQVAMKTTADGLNPNEAGAKILEKGIEEFINDCH